MSPWQPIDKGRNYGGNLKFSWNEWKWEQDTPKTYGTQQKQYSEGSLQQSMLARKNANKQLLLYLKELEKRTNQFQNQPKEITKLKVQINDTLPKKRNTKRNQWNKNLVLWKNWKTPIQPKEK